MRETGKLDLPVPDALVSEFRHCQGPKKNAFDVAGRNGRADGRQRALETLFDAQQRRRRKDAVPSLARCLRLDVAVRRAARRGKVSAPTP